MSNFFADLRFALRQLRKTPVFTVVAVLTLALGIGANTAVFSVMDAVLLRSLPVAHPDGLYYVQMANGEFQPDGAGNSGQPGTSFSMPVFTALRARADVLDALIGFVPLSLTKTAARIGHTPLQTEGEEVSGNFFSGLSAQVPVGRPLTLQDELRHSSAMVISYAFWTRQFDRKASALGTTVYVKGVPFSIVGVAARGFFGIEPGASADFWVPLQNRPDLNAWGIPPAYETLYGTPRWWCLRMMARLRPGVTPQQAQAALAGAFLQAAKSGIGTINTTRWKPLLVFNPARGLGGYSSFYQEPVEILMGLVSLVLLIAMTNVGLMIAARNAARAQEFSLRMALGAGRLRLFRQLLAECGLLVLSGASLGWGFAVEATTFLARMSQIDSGLRPDRSALWLTLAISVAASALFCLAPMRIATRSRASTMAAMQTARTTQSRTGKLGGNAVMATQVAICTVLLVAGSLARRAPPRLPHLAASSTQEAAQDKVDQVKSEARGRVNKVVDDVEQKIDNDKQGSALEELIGGVRCCCPPRMQHASTRHCMLACACACLHVWQDMH